MKRNKKIVIGVIAVIVCIVIGCVGYAQFGGRVNKSEEAKKVQALKISIEKRKKAVGDSKIDFAALTQQNADVYAYIEVPGTAISYPILQSEDGSIDYLNTTIDKEPGLPGSIYTERVNGKEFLDSNTMIYGHNMKNGSMLTDLLKYESAEFLKEHQEIQIYLPDKTITYKVCAAVTFDDRYIMESYHFNTISGVEAYINDIYNIGLSPAVYADDVRPAAEDKLITLSTCIGDKPENRWMVIGVKTDEKQN